MEVSAYLSANGEGETDGLPVIGIEALAQSYHAGELQVVILPVDNIKDHSSLISVFQMVGIRIEDVYLVPRISHEVLDEKKLPLLLTPWYSAKYLPYFEYHIADQCNLNCQACEHYSGLVEEEIYPDRDKCTVAFFDERFFF